MSDLTDLTKLIVLTDLTDLTDHRAHCLAGTFSYGDRSSQTFDLLF